MADDEQADPANHEAQTLGEMVKDPLSEVRKRQLRWSGLGQTADACAWLSGAAALASIVAGVVMLLVGASEGESGGYYGFEYTVVWRPFGAILVAMGLLVGPIAAIGCRTVALVARERAEA
jgi:hypothetical protein